MNNVRSWKFFLLSSFRALNLKSFDHFIILRCMSIKTQRSEFISVLWNSTTDSAAAAVATKYTSLVTWCTSERKMFLKFQTLTKCKLLVKWVDDVEMVAQLRVVVACSTERKVWFRAFSAQISIFITPEPMMIVRARKNLSFQLYYTVKWVFTFVFSLFLFAALLLCVCFSFTDLCALDGSPVIDDTHTSHTMSIRSAADLTIDDMR